jgi:hypothetical protein
MDVSNTGRDDVGGATTCLGTTIARVDCTTAALDGVVGFIEACRALLTIFVQLHILYNKLLKYDRINRTM